MTPQDVRRIALELPAAVESAHMGHPDFRADGKIFATLWPEERRVVVKLHHEQQEQLVRADPRHYVPVSGSWGVQGWTSLSLPTADEATLRSALTMAWRNVAPKTAIFHRSMEHA